MNGAVIKKIGAIAKERGVCRSKLLSEVLTDFVKQA
jgi:hypothetical protein